MIEIRRILALVAAVLFSAPGSAHAQSDATLRVFPRMGLLAPDSYFYEEFLNFSGDGPVEWSTGSLGRAFVAGVGFELELGSGAVKLRGEVLRSFDTWLQVSHSVVVPRVLFEPPRVDVTWLDVPSTVTVTSLHVVLPTRLEVLGAEPYVLFGGGGKRYGFGEATRQNDVEAILPAEGFTWGADVGAGFTLGLLGLGVDVQIRDAVTRYWDKTQHDLIVSGGLLWTVR